MIAALAASSLRAAAPAGALAAAAVGVVLLVLVLGWIAWLRFRELDDEAGSLRQARVRRFVTRAPSNDV